MEQPTTPEVATLDPVQLFRIEGVHRGFLYQHLVAVACILNMTQSGVASVVTEQDEDVELILKGQRIYIQIKTRSAPLAWSDIDSSIDQFATLRKEHSEGRRDGSASFVLLSNSAPNGPLLNRLEAETWSEDVCVQWPGESRGDCHRPVPPSWTDLGEALSWCMATASEAALSALDPETLVWKLAGCVQSAAAGHRDHRFDVGELPNLLQQFVVQLQNFPKPPTPYRAQLNEPPLDAGTKARLVVGWSGAGKTSWASEAALHSEAFVTYFDVGDLPGTAIPASLAREMMGRLSAESPVEPGSFLLSGSGLEMLRLVDLRAAELGVNALVVVDNVHRVSADDLRALIESAPNSRFVMIGQPWVSQEKLETQLGISSEVLEGWSPDTVAAEFRAHGCEVDVAGATRVLAITGGLPLYVRSSALVTQASYEGDTAAFCSAMEAQTHLDKTSQEILLDETFQRLGKTTRSVAAVLSLADVPLTREEALSLLKTEIPNAKEAAKAIRELAVYGIVQSFHGGQLKLHDACRLPARSHASLSDERWLQRRESLRDLLAASLKEMSDISRVSSWMRLLALTGDTATLVDLATQELFHEFGDASDLREILEAASTAPDLTDDDRFWALDALAFWDSHVDDWSSFAKQIESMTVILKEGQLGVREQSSLEMKRMLYSGRLGDHAAIVASFTKGEGLVVTDGAFKLVLRYNYARALSMAGVYSEADEVAEDLAQDYFALLGLDPTDVAAKNPQDLWPLLAGVSNARDKLKRLADCLWLLAFVRKKLGIDSGLALIHAMKFYEMTGAHRSAVKVGQDVVDQFVELGDLVGARRITEGHLLPTVAGANLVDLLIPVRAQHAVVLAYSGEVDAARREMALLESYEVSKDQQKELANQRKLIERIASSRN